MVTTQITMTSAASFIAPIWEDGAGCDERPDGSFCYCGLRFVNTDPARPAAGVIEHYHGAKVYRRYGVDDVLVLQADWRKRADIEALFATDHADMPDSLS